MDQALIQKLTDIVLANLANENFGAEQLAKEAGMSRVNLYRKLESLKHKDISQFIREVRLQRAMEMLRNNEGTASEISYKVGFGSPAYFTKCFHDHYGFPPGEVRKREPVLLESEQISETNTPAGSFHQSEPKKSLIPEVRQLSYKNIVIISVGILIGLLLIFLVYFSILKISGHDEKENVTNPAKSIVVLPFKNLSDDKETEYIAAGIEEDILNQLYKISELRVISRTTSEHFEGTKLTAGEIARKVNARNILEGSVRQYGNKVRISVQLIDAYRDDHFWSENFDRELTDIIVIQSEIAIQVALQLNTVLSEPELRRIKKINTQNPKAYDYYLRGRFLAHKSYTEQRADISEEGLMSSLKYFEKAIAADTNFAEAYASLAGVHQTLMGWGWYAPDVKRIATVEALYTKALEIDPDCAHAHSIKGGHYIWYYRLFEEGRKELQIAARLNPNSPPHQAYAQLLMITGPIEEARIYMDKALEREPNFWVLHNLNAWIYYFEEKYKNAIDACSIARDLKSDYIFTDWLLFLNYTKLGEGIKAAEELQAIVHAATETGKYDKEIMDAFDREGIKGLFTWLIQKNINDPVPAAGLNGQPFFIAWWYAITGNKEESVYWLEKNMETPRRNYTYFNLIATNPDFDILRNDPRFLTIIKKIRTCTIQYKKSQIEFKIYPD